MTRPAAIQLHDVTVAYDRHPAVHHVSGAFAAGTLTAIVGPNGAGKTSLLRALKNEARIEAGGRIELNGLAPRDIAWLPQQAALDRTFPLSCLDVVAMGHWGRAGAFRRLTSDQSDQANAALGAVGLRDFARRPLSTLSAGQFQRVLFARVLLQDAPVILLDEPFNAIDARTTADLMDVVARWHGEGRSVIAVLHDLDLVARSFPHTLLLAREAIAWGPTGHVLTAANRLRARTMAESWSEAAEPCDRAA